LNEDQRWKIGMENAIALVRTNIYGIAELSIAKFSQPKVFIVILQFIGTLHVERAK
jgi:hypothetical protein